MRALVIGGSGQIGGHLLEGLRAGGHAAVGTYATSPAPNLVQLALDDDGAVDAALGDVRPDVVFLPAGWTCVDANEDDPARSRRENLEAPLRVARRCRDQCALFVTYSTDYVFDGAAGPYAEEDPPRPLSVYGRAKLELEEALARELPGQHLLLRSTTVFGPERQGKNFVYQLLRRAAKGERMVVPSDQWATPSYGPDVARATLALVDRGARGVWHVAGPDVMDRVALARLACRVFGVDADRCVEPRTTAELKQKAARPLRGGLRTDRLQALGLGLRGAEEALRAMKAEVEAGRAAPI
ncbi:MAG: SDR family oxidoreductase [Planctomycetota bacterium]|nr:SDR family oxidoreductase [Planctomycetota bacterium]